MTTLTATKKINWTKYPVDKIKVSLENSKKQYKENLIDFIKKDLGTLTQDTTIRVEKQNNEALTERMTVQAFKEFLKENKDSIQKTYDAMYPDWRTVPMRELIILLCAEDDVYPDAHTFEEIVFPEGEFTNELYEYASYQICHESGKYVNKWDKERKELTGDLRGGYFNELLSENKAIIEQRYNEFLHEEEALESAEKQHALALTHKTRVGVPRYINKVDITVMFEDGTQKVVRVEK